MGFRADGIDALVGAVATCHFLNMIGYRAVDLLEVDSIGSCHLRQGKSLRNIVDGDDTCRTLHQGALNAELPDRAATPNGDDVRGFDLAVGGSHPSCRKDVTEEECLLVTHSAGNDDRRYVGVRNSNIFGLTAGIGAGEVRITEQSCRWVSKSLRGVVRISVGFARRPTSSP